MRVAVTGAAGQLGATIVHEFGTAGHEVTPFDHVTLDINDGEAVLEAIESCRAEVIVNAAAYNAVDAAEDRPVDALATNGFAVRNLARAAKARGAQLVHYSTDFVFDGASNTPHTEAERPNPQSVYAVSKMLGEWFATDVPVSYVLRVESLFGRAPGGPPPKGTVATIIERLRAGEVMRVFEDRTVSPSYVIDAARATRQLIEAGRPSGLYHCVNSGSCTWLEFAREAARLLEVDAHLEVVKVADVQLRAARPKYCALSNEKLAAAGIVMPSWQDALARHVNAL